MRRYTEIHLDEYAQRCARELGKRLLTNGIDANAASVLSADIEMLRNPRRLIGSLRKPGSIS